VTLCEPFFTEVCNLIREGAQAGEPRASVYKRLSDLLNTMFNDSTQGDAALANDYAAIEPALAFFADDVIISSNLPFAKDWRTPNLLANHPRVNVVNGNKRFFEMLDGELLTASHATSQRLAIYGACLGLGFGGVHSAAPDQLRQYARNIRGKIDDSLVSRTLTEQICKDAYVVDEQVIYKPVRERLVFIGVMLAALILGAGITWFWMGQASRESINATLDAVITANSR
jgi:type VI protein secretion system component VasF